MALKNKNVFDPTMHQEKVEMTPLSSDIRSPTLPKHLKIHAGVKPCACSACDYRRSQKWNLDSRMQSRHMCEKPYGCDECDGKFQLTEHGRVVMNYVLMSKTIPGIRGEGFGLSYIFNST